MRRAIPILLIPMVFASSAWGQSTVTRESFAAQANPICDRSGNEAVAHLKRVPPLLKRDRLKAAGHEYTRGNLILADAAAEIAALPRPPADAQTIGTWIDQTRAAWLKFANAGRALAHAKLRRFLSLGRQADRQLVQAGTLIQGFGLTSCEV